MGEVGEVVFLLGGWLAPRRKLENWNDWKLDFSLSSRQNWIHSSGVLRDTIINMAAIGEGGFEGHDKRFFFFFFFFFWRQTRSCGFSAVSIDFYPRWPPNNLSHSLNGRRIPFLSLLSFLKLLFFDFHWIGRLFCSHGFFFFFFVARTQKQKQKQTIRGLHRLRNDQRLLSSKLGAVI